jgi:hypothetical protein
LKEAADAAMCASDPTLIERAFQKKSDKGVLEMRRIAGPFIPAEARAAQDGSALARGSSPCRFDSLNP